MPERPVRPGCRIASGHSRTRNSPVGPADAPHRRSPCRSLPDELREVVRLRLFEGLLLEQVAAQLGIGEPAARPASGAGRW